MTLVEQTYLGLHSVGLVNSREAFSTQYLGKNPFPQVFIILEMTQYSRQHPYIGFRCNRKSGDIYAV